MKTKGGLLNAFKLHYEALPSEPRRKPSANKKRPEGAKKKPVGNNIHTGLNFLVAHYMVFHRRRAISDRSAILANINDRKTVPKVPLSNKKRTANSKR